MTNKLRFELGRLALIARHPSWVGSAVFRGRVAVTKELVVESLNQLARAPPLVATGELYAWKPMTFLGRLGATQEVLYQVIRVLRPDTVVETGVFRGISSAFILQALAENGKGQLYSIDMPGADYAPGAGVPRDRSPLPAGSETGWAIPPQLRARWKLIVGNSKDELPRLLARLQKVDVFYHDSEHTYEHMTWEYSEAARFLTVGGALCSDDIGWNSAYRDFTRAKQFKRIGEFGGRIGVAIRST